MRLIFSSLKPWLSRHGTPVAAVASLPLAIWLIGIAASTPLLPIEGLGIIAAVFFFTRPTSINSEASFLRQLIRQLPAQLIAGAVCIAAGRLIWAWPWATFFFIPLWILLPPLALFLSSVAIILWKLRDNPVPALPAPVLRALARAEPLFQKALVRRDDVALTGALGLWAVGFIAGRFEPALGLDAASALLLAIVWWALDLVPLARWQFASGPRELLSRFAGRLFIWSSLCVFAALATGAGLILKTAAWLLIANLALGCFALTHVRGVIHGSENARRALLGVCAFWLISPYASYGLLGAGDALWYANTLADFLAQIHAGTFPVFVGQSEYLFNGGVFPIRFAPLFQHYGMLVNAITLGSLDPAGVQNMIIVGSLLAATFTIYFVLSRLLPEQRGLVWALSALYISCPGVLSVAYFADLLMSWTTLPWLPVAFGGSLLAFRERGPIPYLMMSGGLGLLWWGHSPIAIWSTLAVGTAQLIRLIAFRPRFPEWRGIAVGVVVFALLMLYPLVSVLGVPINPAATTADYAATRSATIEHFINESFPALLLPLNANNPSLAFFQPGWAILLLISVCLITGLRERIHNLDFWVTLFAPLALLLLLIPIPFLNSFAWSAMPGFLRNPTGSWPMQRFNVIIAASSVCAVASLAALPIRRPKCWLCWLLVPGLIWSFWESRSLIYPKDEQRRAIELRPFQRLPENNVLTRNAYLVFGQAPSYYSHGHVEPLLENRLLGRETRQLIMENSKVVITPATGAKLLHSDFLIGKQNDPQGPWDFSTVFRLETGEHYELEIDFTQPDAEGVLILEGPKLSRVYQLPSYGGTRSFGSTTTSSHLISLSTSSPSPESFTLRFFAQGISIAGDFSGFGRYRWFKVNLDKLPIHVTDWIPYKARVQSPSEAWLETPRMFQPGYQATVNGKTATVAKSPEGLVMVPVPAGPSRVILSYQPPRVLVVSYWLSFGTIIALALALAYAAWRHARTVTGWPFSPANQPAPP
jgi:hypothetical protein